MPKAVLERKSAGQYWAWGRLIVAFGVALRKILCWQVPWLLGQSMEALTAGWWVRPVEALPYLQRGAPKVRLAMQANEVARTKVSEYTRQSIQCDIMTPIVGGVCCIHCVKIRVVQTSRESFFFFKVGS